METLQFKHTFSSGVIAEIKKDGTSYYLSLSGTPLDGVLQALQLTSLDLPALSADIDTLSRILAQASAFIRTTGI